VAQVAHYCYHPEQEVMVSQQYTKIGEGEGEGLMRLMKRKRWI
jgi:hypothetical protein